LILELLVIGIVVFSVIRFLQGTRGVRVLKGIVVLLISLYLLVRILGGFFDLNRLDILFSQFLFYASFAAIVVFQPELRRALMRLGETRLLRGSTSGTDEIEEIVEACTVLSRRRIGALIAFEKDETLTGFTEGAVRIDAETTRQLVTTIFHPNTALHDLGVVVRDGRIAYANVQFPLADSGDLAKELGSRHRAAAGLSSETDAVIVVVSEETGDISIAERGHLHRKLPIDRLHEMLHELLNRSVATSTSSDRGKEASDPELRRLDSLVPKGAAKPKTKPPSSGGAKSRTMTPSDFNPEVAQNGIAAKDDAAKKPKERRKSNRVDGKTDTPKTFIADGEIRETKPVGASTLPPTPKADDKPEPKQP
jgi:diadenylate cyclase